MSVLATKCVVRVIESDAEAIEAAERLATALSPGSSQRDLDGFASEADLALLAESGLLGINVPREHNGAQVSYVTIGEVFRILAAADPAVAQIPQNHFHFVTAIERDGDETQKAYFFREVLDGARFGNALQERGPGFRVTGTMQTRLTSDGYSFRLNGSKVYATGAVTAQWIPVFALDDFERLVLAYVDRSAAGVEIDDSEWFAFGQRATRSGSATFSNVVVPRQHVIEHWRTIEQRTHYPAFAQQMHAAIDVGIAEAALADSVDFVRERSRPWVESGVQAASLDPHIIYRFGELKTKLTAAEQLLLHAGAALDRAEADPENLELVTEASLAVATAKAFAGDTALEISNELFALAGTSSTDSRLNLSRHWRNARTHTLHDPNRWKFHHIGNHLLNEVRPPLSGVI
jgi:SfnB family sulfur acquisition oxidoreductase